jgi:hypothetical protein
VYFLLIRSKCLAVTARLGIFGNACEAEGTSGDKQRTVNFQSEGMVQLIRTRACHAGGHGFESRSSREHLA